MADDLGDSHVKSLRQGGRLPASSTAQRTAGRIFADAGKPITVQLFPEVNGRSQRIVINNAANQQVRTVTGTSSNTAPLTASFTPTAAGWYSILVNSSTSNQAAQRVWVNVTYTAPATVNTRNGTLQLRSGSPAWIQQAGEQALSLYPNPTSGAVRLQLPGIRSQDAVQVTLYQYNGVVVTTIKATLSEAETLLGNKLTTQSTGLYFIQVQHEGKTSLYKVVKQ